MKDLFSEFGKIFDPKASRKIIDKRWAEIREKEEALNRDGVKLKIKTKK